MPHSEEKREGLKTTSFSEFQDRVTRNYSPNNADNDNWKLKVQATLGILGDRPWDVICIYKVPNKLRKLKEDAYNPQIVSIGPLHQRKHELRDMEEHKWRYMLNYFRRYTPDEEENVPKILPSIKASERCGDVVLNLAEKARTCYFEEINLQKHELADVLLVDGCFMLQLFIRLDEEKGSTQNQRDPIISNSWMIPTLQHDLALLENQIPFSVLYELFKIIKKLNDNKDLGVSLNKHVLFFFGSALNLSSDAIDRISNSIGTPKHLLDIFHNVYKPTIPRKPLKGHEDVFGFRSSATNLVMSGIEFQAGNPDIGSLLDIKHDNRVITIPPLQINENTESIFRNLIAYEQCSFAITHHISSYARLMTSLIRSSQDVKFLKQKMIITTKLPIPDQDVTTLFNDLCTKVVFKEFYFDGLCEEVNAYHKSWLNWDQIKAAEKVRWRGYITTFQEEYLRSPWTIISLAAALVLLILTLMATYYAARTYYSTYHTS